MDALGVPISTRARPLRIDGDVPLRAEHLDGLVAAAARGGDRGHMSAWRHPEGRGSAVEVADRRESASACT